MTKLRWGLLGTSRINSALIPPLRASARNEPVAVASRHLERARAYAQVWDLPRTFGSYEALVADPGVDVVYNALPNSLHAEWTIRAAQAGKHVLCEKPLALSVDEVDAIADAAARAGVVVMEAFMYRHHPLTLAVHELVAGGAVGALRLVRGAFTFDIASEEDVRLDPALGGGSVWDLGCYPVSYARLLVGAEPVAAAGWQTTGASGVDELFCGQLRFPGDVYLQFDCGFRAPYRTHLEVVGSDGTLVVPHPFKPEQHEPVVLHSGGQSQVFTVAGQDLYAGEVENMADAILEGRPPRVGLADSRGNVAALEALLRAARAGAPVVLP